MDTIVHFNSALFVRFNILATAIGSQQEGPRFKSPRVFSVDCAWSPCVQVGCIWVLRIPPPLQTCICGVGQLVTLICPQVNV